MLLTLRHDAIHDTDKEGRTPLIWAAASNNAPLIRALVGADAHLNTRDRAGRSALDHAIEANNAKCIAVLQQMLAESRGARKSLTSIDDGTSASSSLKATPLAFKPRHSQKLGSAVTPSKKSDKKSAW